MDEAYDYSKTNRDSAVIKTMNKLPMYIKHIEREYDLTILNQTKKETRHSAIESTCVHKEKQINEENSILQYSYDY